MRYKKLLAIVLLSLSFCFASGVGYGKEFTLEEVREISYKQKATELDLNISNARTSYIMDNPTIFLNVYCIYDAFGLVRFDDLREKKLPFYGIISTKGKLVVWIRDNRAAFSGKSGVDLLMIFHKHLLAFIYTSGTNVGTLFPYDTHVLAIFYSEEKVPLGYFYQGEYHLWEE